MVLARLLLYSTQGSPIRRLVFGALVGAGIPLILRTKRRSLNIGIEQARRERPEIGMDKDLRS